VPQNKDYPWIIEFLAGFYSFFIIRCGLVAAFFISVFLGVKLCEYADLMVLVILVAPVAGVVGMFIYMGLSFCVLIIPVFGDALFDTEMKGPNNPPNLEV
jgi:hypothetical protein